MKFQYISDIHLERGTKIIINAIADYLILAGDIGDPFTDEYYDFLKDVSGKFKTIFLITGNHEYFSKIFTMIDTENQIRNITNEFTNIIYLQNNVYNFIDSDISIFGTTLWTPCSTPDMPIESTPEFIFNNLDTYENNKMFIQDYRTIPEFTIEKRNKLHDIALQAIQKLDKSRKYIVITHHVPKYDLINIKYKTNPFNSAYVCNVTELDESNILKVVYGHTHLCNISGKYHCNPVGLPGENQQLNTEEFFEV